MSPPHSERREAEGLHATFPQYLALLSAERLEYTDGRVLCRPRPSTDRLVARLPLFRLLTAAAGRDRAVRVATP
jgi:hypothetical protein